MHLSGRQVQDGFEVYCPIKCTKPTFVADGRVENLPKNFALMDLVHESRERSPSLSTPRLRASSFGHSPTLKTSQYSLSSSSCSSESFNYDVLYNCDVCETNEASVVCPSCSVVLCLSCSNDIHKRKGYHLHQLVSITEFFNSQGEVGPSTGAISPKSTSESESEFSLGEQQCKLHPAETMEFFCETCYEEVCKHCKMVDHRDHECRLLVDVASEKKESLRRAVQEVNECHAKWNTSFDSCHELREHLFDRRRTLEALIKSRFHSIHSTLHVREEVLLGQVQKEIESRSKLLNSQAK